jgi:hypothetical protein
VSLIKTILETYPELKDEDFIPATGIIHLRDDSDGNGAYIAKWDYDKPIPKGLKLGK